MKILKFNQWLLEGKKPKGAPDWHDSDAPDAEGRFRDLSIKDLAAWLIKTRKGDLKRISGSLTQQIVFNRNDDPKYAEKMEKTRKEVYKQLGREDLLKEAYGNKYPKNNFLELGMSDVKDYVKDIFDLINNAYEKKGGNLEIKSPNDIIKSDITYWITNDIDSDPDIDVVLGGKTTQSGKKMTILGQDGSREAKKLGIEKLVNLMKTKGFYAEMDQDLTQKMGLPYIKDEKIIRKVINKNLTMNDDGSYFREIGGEPHTKVLVGIPK